MFDISVDVLLVLPGELKSVSLVSGQTGDKTGARGLLVVNKTHTLPAMLINVSWNIPCLPACFTFWKVKLMSSSVASITEIEL